MTLGSSAIALGRHPAVYAEQPCHSEVSGGMCPSPTKPAPIDSVTAFPFAAYSAISVTLPASTNAGPVSTASPPPMVLRLLM